MPRALSTAEWAASLTAKQVLGLITEAMHRHDMEGVAAGIHLLAVKDPGAAAMVLAVLEARGAEDDEGDG